MLGITVADAVLVGTLVIALLAAWRGARDGKAAQSVKPPAPEMAILGATLVDTNTFRDLVRAVDALTEAVLAGVAAKREEAEDRIADLLEEVRDKLNAPQRSRRRPSRAKRQ